MITTQIKKRKEVLDEFYKSKHYKDDDLNSQLNIVQEQDLKQK